MARNLDLFGDPVPPNHGRRGRPAHIATRENHNKVLLLLALGWTNQRIGAALAIAPKSFARIIPRSCKTGNYSVRPKHEWP
jgi:hypothetical protein